jgi:hypothetical protein
MAGIVHRALRACVVDTVGPLPRVRPHREHQADAGDDQECDREVGRVLPAPAKQTSQNQLQVWQPWPSLGAANVRGDCA